MATAMKELADLDSGHPCFGCAVRAVSLCGVLESDALRAYKQTGTTLRVEPGATIFYEGDPAAKVYTLTEGTLRLSKLLPDGRRQITGFLFPGDFLGLTVADEHAFTAEAITPAVLCKFPRPRFERFLEDHPEMERRLYAIAAHELSAARHQMVLLGRKTATERVVSFLLMLADRCRRHGEIADEIALPMTRTDIADYLGLRIETVSRELSALKASGMVRFGSMHDVRLLAKERLRMLAAA